MSKNSHSPVKGLASNEAWLLCETVFVNLFHLQMHTVKVYNTVFKTVQRVLMSGQHRSLP